MRFLHVLLAIALTLGGVRARLVQAVVQRRRRGVLVVNVALALLLRWPAIFVIFALVDRAFVWPIVCFDVLGKVARALKLFIALRAFMDLWFRVLLAPGHGAKDIFIGIFVGNLALHGCGSQLFLGEGFSRGETDDLSVLVAHKLGGLSVVTHTAMQRDSLIAMYTLA